ncbi:MAG: hypothetical protein HC890_13960 [Chloroflexaceae bacterium]|nr:hypothetical protein [Chloroflexaceae bacterium]
MSPPRSYPALSPLDPAIAVAELGPADGGWRPGGGGVCRAVAGFCRTVFAGFQMLFGGDRDEMLSSAVRGNYPWELFYKSCLRFKDFPIGGNYP